MTRILEPSNRNHTKRKEGHDTEVHNPLPTGKQA